MPYRGLRGCIELERYLVRGKRLKPDSYLSFLSTEVGSKAHHY